MVLSSETIIPEAQERFVALTLRDTHLFGGLGLRSP